MTIPNFNSEDDSIAFLNMFKARWDNKLAMMNWVKQSMFPGYDWDQLQGQTVATINDITQSLLYDVEVDFEKKFPEYKSDDEVFIPYRSFKENVTEALKEAMDTANKEKWFHPESGLAKNFDLGEK